jgi:hypothetical protein
VLTRFNIKVCLIISFSVLITYPSYSATLLVGKNQVYKIPSEAAAAAHDGDHIAIQPAEYTDCAVWRSNNLVIEGIGPNVVITDKTCSGKGIFVVSGNNTTIRNLTLARARVPDMNGAGIRLDGGDLVVDGVNFINNQNGILGGVPGGKVSIINSNFDKNGYCGNEQGCAHAIYINNVDVLSVKNSKFTNTQMGHSIKSRALKTEIVGCNISDGLEGTSSYLIDVPNGGTLLISDNILEKGPKSQNHNAAIEIGAEGVTHPTNEILIRNNTFSNDGDFVTAFFWNVTATRALLNGNKLSGQVTALRGDGIVE